MAACCESGGSCCGVLPRAMAIVLIATLAGSLHSWRTPVSIRLEDPAKDASPAKPVTGANAAKPPVVAPSPQQVGQPASLPATKPGAIDVDALPAHITLEQAKALYDQGIAFVDAREDHEREEGWITGSVHLTAAMMSGPKLPDEFDLLDREAATIIYCAGGTCDASENLAILLKQAGFAKLHIFHDGFPAWKAAGFPIEGSTK